MFVFQELYRGCNLVHSVVYVKCTICFLETWVVRVFSWCFEGIHVLDSYFIACLFDFQKCIINNVTIQTASLTVLTLFNERTHWEEMKSEKVLQCYPIRHTLMDYPTQHSSSQNGAGYNHCLTNVCFEQT